MNGNGEKKLDEMTTGELVSFLLNASGDYLQDDSDNINVAFWVENQ